MFEILFLAALGVPFFYLWNNLAPIYLPQLPPLYLHVPLLHCVEIFALIAIVRMLLSPRSRFFHHRLHDKFHHKFHGKFSH